MKITDKIVTSITQPQQTNVLWHNPETGELKMFGNKGWEVVGGNPGEGGGNASTSISGGYPIVTVEDDFNITAEPNTFYNIKNNADSEVSINFKAEEFYSTGNTVNEFIFNINSPCNIIFNEEIKWNNDNTPDLTKTGIYTISILNGVGCYTFVNN